MMDFILRMFDFLLGRRESEPHDDPFLAPVDFEPEPPVEDPVEEHVKRLKEEYDLDTEKMLALLLTRRRYEDGLLTEGITSVPGGD